MAVPVFPPAGGGGGGGGFPSTATAFTKDNTGSPSANIPFSGLGGPALLYFDADGTPHKPTAAQLLSAAGYDPGQVFTVGGAVQDLDLTGLAGDTDGDYEINGVIVTPAAGTPTYSLQPNGLTTNQFGGQFKGGTGFSAAAVMLISQIGTEPTLSFNGYFSSKSGRVRTWDCRVGTLNVSTAAIAWYGANGYWNETATAITKITVHASVASGIGTGSFVRIRKMGFTA